MVFVGGGYRVKIYDNQPGQAAKAITEIRSAFFFDNSVDVVGPYILRIPYMSHQAVLHMICLEAWQ